MDGFTSIVIPCNDTRVSLTLGLESTLWMSLPE